MNPYELIMAVQQRVQSDPVFAQKFNYLIGELNSIPGLRNEVMKIVNINDPKKRDKAVEKLPKKAKEIVNELMMVLNS